MKHLYLLFLNKVSNCITELLSFRISDVGTVTPHAIVGYCSLQWLTSIQDVPTELLEGSFVVDRLFPCSLSVFVCVCVWVRLCFVNKICLCPQSTVDRALLCVAATFFSLFPPMGYWVCWVVMATGKTLFTMIFLFFILNKERMKM